MFWQQPVNSANKVVSVPAPVGGINARDSLAAMPETDAIVLQNWWPQPYGVSVRRGYREWATGMPSQVSTIATWSEVDGTQTLFAWSADSMYDITISGAVGAPLVTGLTSAYWESVNLLNAAGAHLIAVNGLDDGIIYDSGGVARIVAGDGIVPNTWAGLDPKDATMVTVHQHRLWAVEKNTANGWFLPPDALQGTFLKYDFGPLFGRGGYLSFIVTWTMDDGNGAEDHLIAVSSRGEAAVFAGTDPEDDQAWFLVGVYYLGSPTLGVRGHAKAGGDQLILCQQGLVSMSTQLVSTKVNQAQEPLTTAKIQFLISALTSTYAPFSGWEVKYVPKFNMVLINVPSITIGGNIQLAANQITNAWTQFNGMDSACWGIYGSTPMFGDYAGRVLLAWEGNVDNILLDGTGGVGIIANVLQAYSYMGQLATQKQVSMYRPTFVVNAPITLNTQIFYDFLVGTLTTPTAPGKQYDALWNYGIWNTAIWGGGDEIQKQWIQGQGMGVAASLGMATQTEGEVLWVSTDYTFVGGQGLL